MLRVSLSRRHTPHLHLHNDDGTRRRKTDHPRPETKVVSAARGSVGGVCFGDTDYTRGRKYVSRIIAARVSLSLSLCSLTGLISRSARFRPSNVPLDRVQRERKSLTDKTTVFALYIRP